MRNNPTSVSQWRSRTPSNTTPQRVEVNQRNTLPKCVSHHISRTALAPGWQAIPNSKNDVGQPDNPTAGREVCVFICSGRFQHFNGRMLNQLAIRSHIGRRKGPLDIGKRHDRMNHALLLQNQPCQKLISTYREGCDGHDRRSHRCQLVAHGIGHPRPKLGFIEPLMAGDTDVRHRS